METIKKYNNHQKEISTKIDLLVEKLKKHNSKFENNQSNWGYVGDIDFVSKKLDEILEFIK